MKFTRLLSKPHTSHISDQVKWKICDSKITTANGNTIFEMNNIEVPESWSQNAINILAQKYFRKAGVPLNTNKIFEDNLPEWLFRSEEGWNLDSDFGPETSAKQVFHRIAGAWTYYGWKEGIFGKQGESTPVIDHAFMKENARIFYDEIYLILANQIAAPNSPQFFNTGLHWAYGITGNSAGQWAINSNGNVFETSNAYEYPQPHACFIQPISDNLVDEDGIFDLVKKEARLFKFGSGTGSNFSNLRSKYELLSGGGKSSGLISFLKIFDAAAGAVQSGGTTRRAAKMVIVDLDHPEIEDFVEWKMKEEAKAAALYIGSKILNNLDNYKNLDLDIPQAISDRIKNNIIPEICNLDFESEAISTVSGQNANNSPRITDKFLQAVKEDSDWNLTARTDGKVIKIIKARDLWLKICRAAWACADPGIHFQDTINLWHTCKSDGEIKASNPCSEYLFLDDTACNLASLNLVKFQNKESKDFNTKLLHHVTRIMTVVLEISVFMASFPSKEIAENSYKYRTLGLGYANLGGLFMRKGIGYDSDKARDLASYITALMHGIAYKTSAEMAQELGPFSRFEANRASMLEVILKHYDAARKLNNKEVNKVWEFAKNDPSFRNAQVTLIAPTGTISFVMDCDCFGIEPDFSLVKYKSLAGGGMMKIVNECVPEALESLGYTKAQILSITQHISETDTIEGWTLNGQPMSEEHLRVFDCAIAPKNGKRFLRPEAHLLMMAAVQPFLSGAISKTVNMPRESTIQDVDKIFHMANDLKLKAVAIYRDGSKLTQPLNTEREKPTRKPYDSASAIDKAIRNAPPFPCPDPGQESEPGDINTPQFWAEGDEAEIRLQHEQERLKQNGTIGSNGSINPYTFSKVEILLNHLDQARNSNNLRRRLPSKTTGYTQKVRINGQSVYLHTSDYEDGSLGAIFLELSREGSTVRALINAIGIAVSIGLQHNVPLEKFVQAFVYRKFEPAGIVQGHKNIKMCTSILDYIFRDLAIHYLNQTDYANVVDPFLAENLQAMSKIEEEYEKIISDNPEVLKKGGVLANHLETITKSSNTGMICPNCHHSTLIQVGTCVNCSTCSYNTGCG